MKCVADENVDSAIVTALRSVGHDVWYVAEEARGILDDEVLQKAADENALLLTSDKDFGDLVFRQGKADSGVLLIRLAGVPALEKATIVTRVFRDHRAELHGAFSVLTRAALRIRKKGLPE